LQYASCDLSAEMSFDRNDPNLRVPSLNLGVFCVV
jgi:hypothetical protein